MRTLSIESAINRISERVTDERKNTRHDQVQRRNQVVDLYGVEYSAMGDTQTPARFYISITPDMIYLERFEFKLIVNPFAMPVGNSGATSNAVVQVNSTQLTNNSITLNNSATSLTIDGEANTVQPNPHNHNITPQTHTHEISPNPHNHTTQEHNHALSPGISLFQSNITDFQVWIEGINITSYLQAQYPGVWVDGNGVYPSSGLDNYDIIELVGLLPDWQKGIILQPGFKTIECRANGVFSVSLLNYLKLSHCNR